MSILVYIENDNGEVKKASQEAIAYASGLAKQLGTDCVGLAVNISESELTNVGNYGVGKVLSYSNDGLAADSISDISAAIAAATQQAGTKVVVLASTSLGEAVSARLAIKLDASLGTNVIGLPDTGSGFVVRKGVYTGKAFCKINLKSENKVLTVKKNGYDFEKGSESASIESIDLGISSEEKVQVKEIKKQEGTILLPEADLVVSAGRGLKGPENWGMIEELAQLLGAATACSKPVSDADWRPHHEHVGQTGIKVSPNLYIAVGISGAIQHLAGVSSSKTIVVINTDEEAPFFKAADYGIIGDAFEVIPKLIEALKN